MHEDTVAAVLDSAAKRGVEAEVYCTRTDETPVEFENNRLKTLRTRASAGLALRVISAGRLGFASSTDLGRTDALLDAALETARIGDPVDFEFARGALAREIADYRAPSTAHFVEQGQALIERVRAYHPDLLVSASFSVRRCEVAIATTAGAVGHRQRTVVSASLSANLVRGEDLLEVYSSGLAREGEPDYESLAAEVLRKLHSAEQIARATSGPQAVLFTPYAAASTLGGLFRTVFSGQAVTQKTSPLSGKLGEVLFDPRLTLYEDPTVGASAAPFDDEGTPTAAKHFVRAGAVHSFYWDRTWAARAGIAPGGNGLRSGLGRPAPALLNLCIAPGATPQDELIRSIEHGVIVEQVLGAGQSNLLAGEFSVNLDLGYKIEHGQVVGRVKNTMVAGNLFESFRHHLAELSSERQWIFGSAHLPAILFEHLGVASRG
jgi:PmbA protein